MRAACSAAAARPEQRISRARDATAKTTILWANYETSIHCGISFYSRALYKLVGMQTIQSFCTM